MKKLCFILIVFFWQSSLANDTLQNNDILSLAEYDHYLGNNKAKITIIEYSSFSCPACANYNKDIFPKIKEQYIDNDLILYIVRNYPANEPGLYSAVISECFSNEHFKTAKILYNSQEKWLYRKDFKNVLKNIFRLSQYNMNNFDLCINDEKLKDEILEKAFYAAKTLKVNSTPDLYINGDRIMGEKNFKNISNIIDKYLSRS